MAEAAPVMHMCSRHGHHDCLSGRFPHAVTRHYDAHFSFGFAPLDTRHSGHCHYFVAISRMPRCYRRV